MKKLLLFSAIVGMTFAACKKETVFPVTASVQEDAYWYLHINGMPLDSFRVTYYTSVIPYNIVDYSNVLCCGVSPILVKMKVGQTYSVKYMKADSTMALITHTPTKIETLRDTIRATVY